MISSYQKRGLPNNYLYILRNIQENQGKLFWQLNQKEDKIAVIKKHLQDESFSSSEWPLEEISEKIYNDIFEQTILTSPLKDIWVKEIRIIAWDNIQLTLTNGQIIPIDGFYSADHAKETILSLLSQSNDLSFFSETLYGHLHITAILPPLIRESQGIYCTISKYGYRKFMEQDYLSSGFATKKELDLINLSLRYGLSVLICGKYRSGRTSFMDYLLGTIKDDELTAIALEERHELQNATSCIYTNMDASEIMKLNPDWIAFNLDSNMIAPQEFVLKGYVTLTETLGSGADEALYQITENWLNNMLIPLDYHTAYRLTAKAFPLIITIKVLNGKHRITNISESVGSQINTIWEFSDNHHKQVSEISMSYQQLLLNAGCSEEQINQIKKENA